MVGAASAPAGSRPPAPPGRFGAALATVAECLPALVGAWLVLRVVETLHAGAAGVKVGTLFGPALANDLLALLRHACLLLPVALPLALLPARRARVLGLGCVWTLLLAAEALLVQYHWTAGVPLGADLFGYSRAEIATTLGTGTGAGVDPVLGLGLAAAIGVLWGLLRLSSCPWWPRPGARGALLAAAASSAALAFAPAQFVPPGAANEAGIDYLRNKMAYVVDRSLIHVAQGRGPAAGSDGGAHAGLPWSGKDPRYPFLHADRTPDTLGPLLATRPGPPPNLVFIIVEGLGRSFSGPGARLGSFTPFLDELGKRSLYFENFLSGQGRTFGVLSTVFGSLPFGRNGLADLGARMPRHDSLLSILKEQGYRLDYYSGSNLEFDNQGAFLRAEGVEHLMSERDFAPPFERSGYWGYADRDLVVNTLRHQQAALQADRQSTPPRPSLGIIQTVSMHDPFEFPGKPAYLEKVGQRLATLGIAPGANPAYTTQRAIFASVLYTDDALRLYFEQAAKLPGYENTIFVITGDHRLPELPMDTRIERYHVPLIVYSPMLKEARSIKAVSSQFDIAPSVLALLAHNHGIETPRDVTWLGTGLDTAREFRNLHAIPLKQTKTELSDFVSGTVYLAQDRLFTLADGMATDRALDDAALAKARAQFTAFEAANRVAGSAAALAPQAARRAPYREEGRDLAGVALASSAGRIGVGGVRLRAGSLDTVEATLHNGGAAPSPAFVPLLVVSDANGFEVAEVQAAPRTLAAGASARLAFTVRLGKVPHGTYYVSVIPSHPETGRPLGVGQYHVEMRL